MNRQDVERQTPRRPARDLIDAVLDNMRKNIELLKYSALAPSRYLVYLHPTEYERLEGIVPILQDQTVRALTEELDALNRRSALQRCLDRVRGQSQPRVQTAALDWDIQFLSDPDGDLNEGDLLVDSALMLPARPELGLGERTRRITTLRSGQHTTTRARTDGGSPSPSDAGIFARIAYDDNSGHHVHEVAKDSVTIGRGGIAYPVDIRIVSSVDVSREHARIRRDPQTGRSFLIDLSSLGTTLNGRHVPCGYEEVNGAKRENGAETPLPDRARIGLADTVYLDFQRVGS
jgi:hypothetical protein